MMRKSILFVIVSLVVSSALSTALSAAMTKGTPNIQSVGSLAFGPDGILLVGDSVSGSIFAVDLDDRTSGGDAAELEVTDIDEKLAAMLGTTAKRIRIHDMAVNPISQNTYLAVSRGTGEETVHVLIRVTPAGEISDVTLQDVSFDVKTITRVVAASRPRRSWSDVKTK